MTSLNHEKILLPPELDLEKLEAFPHADKIPIPVRELLIRRGITTEEQLKSFFKSGINEIHDPFLLSDMDKAVERVFTARQNGEKVMVYGDYDVDGITSTSLLLLYFREIFLDGCDFFIPNRMDDGYGLCNEGIDEALKKDIDLIITVDCGISSIEETDYATSKGIDVIIVDHHIPSSELPKAFAVINSKKENDSYPNKDLSGVGTTFKLVQALYEKEDESLKSEIDIFKYLDIVALGTAADLVPVTGENRILLREGLLKLRTSSNEGVKALLKTAQLFNNSLSTTSIVFKLAPLINAVGRMDDPSLGVKLFLSDTFSNGLATANKMKELNLQRQKLDRSITDECVEKIKTNPSAYGESVIVIDSSDWHIGVIGIVASRLVEKFGKPAIVITSADGEGKGSCRSKENLLNMHEALSSCNEKLLSYGGHKYAAGISINPGDIDEFRSQINQYREDRSDESDNTRTLEVDIDMPASNIDEDLLKWIKRFEPFGPGNMKPVFHSGDLLLEGYPKIVGKTHLKFQVRADEGVLDCIGFNFADRINRLGEPRSALSIAYTLEENEWMGRKSLQLNLRGIE